METFEVMITLPTLNEVFGWFVFWVCIGSVVNAIHCFSFVWCNYGRTANSMTWYFCLAMVVIDTIFWPANIKNIRDNFSNECFHIDVSDYM